MPSLQMSAAGGAAMLRQRSVLALGSRAGSVAPAGLAAAQGSL